MLLSSVSLLRLVKCAMEKMKPTKQKNVLGIILVTIVTPMAMFYLYYNNVWVLETFQLLFGSYIFLSVILPILFKFSYTMQRNVVFLNNVNLPRFAKYDNPCHHGLTGTRNFYMKTEDGMYIGVWHILPESLIKDIQKEDEEEYFEKTLNFGFPVFVYMHGNSSNRAAGHHIELHKILRKKYHIITFDYRGYGDSTGLPFTEHLVVTDALSILHWVKNLTTAPILVWGHSLGTAIATHALRILCQQRNCFVEGLVLESPFDNMRNEVGEHPMTVFFRNLPWFHFTVVDSIYNSGFLFSSDDHITHVNCPILVLHAEDDWVVPFRLGFHLYTIGAKHRTKDQGAIRFEAFSKKLGCGHKYICRAPQLPNILQNFVNECLGK